MELSANQEQAGTGFDLIKIGFMMKVQYTLASNTVAQEDETPDGAKIISVNASEEKQHESHAARASEKRVADAVLLLDASPLIGAHTLLLHINTLVSS